MSTHRERNRYMAEYMRQYRARKVAERAGLRTQAESREPNIEAMLTRILKAVTTLSERVSRIEAVLTKVNVNREPAINALTEANMSESDRALTEPNVNTNVNRDTLNPAVNALTEHNVNNGKPKAKERRTIATHYRSAHYALTEANVNADKPTAEDLAREAQALHVQGLSYEQIAKRWTEEGKPTLKGGKWHRGTIVKMVQRHTGQ